MQAIDPIRKQLFVENLTLRMSPYEAAIAAGFTGGVKRIATQLMADEDVQAMIESHKRALEAKYDVSKGRVLNRLVDATDMAETMSDPKAMVMALKEVSEVMGHHAPKQVAVEQNIHVNQNNVRAKLRQVPDDKLLELADEADFESVELLPSKSG